MNKSANNKYIFILLFLGLITLNITISAQKFEPENISIPQGLSNAEVNCIYQDKYGLLWIGTADGLNKYDGYSFQTFEEFIKSDPNFTKQIKENLEGKDLVCFCKPKRCHGDTLLRIANEDE